MTVYLTPYAVLDSVPLLDAKTPALGGPDAPMNKQAQALLNRLTAVQIALQSLIDQVDAKSAAALAASNSGVIGYATLALMDADLAHADGTIAWVTNDPTATNNGTYRKTGTIGSGSWVFSSYDRVAVVEAQVSGVVSDLGGAVKQVVPVGLFFTDGLGRVAASIGSTGEFQVASLRPSAIEWSTDVSSQPSSNPSYVMTWSDSWGKIAMSLSPQGTVSIAKLQASEAVTGSLTSSTATISHLTADRIVTSTGSSTTLPDILALPAYGQSWTLGFDGQPSLSTTRYSNIMFNGGVRSQSYLADPDNASILYASFVPMAEANSAGTPGFPTYPCGETYCTTQCDAFVSAIQRDMPADIPLGSLQLFSSCPGEGSKRIEELDRGTVYYTRLLAQVTAAYNLAQSAGKSFSVPLITWVQSTSLVNISVDGGTAAYPVALETLRSNLDTDIRAITHQAETVKLLTWQLFPTNDTNGGSRADQVYKRHVLSADTYPHIYCVGGSYFLDQVSPDPSSVHLTNTSQKWLGAQMGEIAKRILVDGEDWKPLKPISVVKQGRLITVRFHVPYGKIVWDTERCALAENYGFNVFTAAASAGGATELTVSSVSIVNKDTIRIVMASTVPSGAVLRYASKGAQQGRISGIRGNLRDTMGDVCQWDGYPLNNWCVSFEELIV